MIIGYFGLPGSGKSYLMAVDSIKLIKKGYNLYSNYPVRGAYKLDYDTLLQVPRFQRPALLLLDEVQRFANSRQWQALPDSLYFIFSQGRKLGLDLYYSAQDSSRVDKTLREVTNLFNDIRSVRLFSRIFPGFRKVDIYSNNANYSLQIKALSSRFFRISSKRFIDFNSFYMINKGSFSPVDVSFSKWLDTEIVPVDGSGAVDVKSLS